MPGQSIRIPIELELKNIQGAINSLKSALGGVSKESGFYKTVGKEIEQVEKKFKELSAIASRPFGGTSAISNFENQFLKLGDKITAIGKSFNDLSFKDLNLQGIPEAEEKFNKLKIEVDKTQKALNAINTNQMKNSLADSTSGLEEAFNKIKNFNKGNSLLDENSFEKTFSALEEKAISLSEKILEAQTRLERLKTANAQTETKLGFFDEAQKKIQEFISGSNLTSEAFANILQPLANQAGMTPERFLDLLGLNKQDLYSGTAEEIQKKLNNAIASKKTNLTNTFSNKQAEITGLEATIQGFNNYANAVQEAKNKLEELKNSQATQTQLEEAKQKYQEATEGLNNFIETCLKMNPALRNAGNSLKVTGDAVNSLPGKTSAARAELDRLNDSANKLSQLKSRMAYFFSFYKVMNTIRNVVREATTTIKDLDSVMTEISVVTQMTQEDLWNQMDTYKAIANEYAVSIKGVYEVSQLYYQQGLQTAQVMDLTVETLKMAKIANIDYATATDYMTVAVRGFKMEMSDAQRVTDVYSALAATTASDTEELAVAMSKTASSAEAVGSSFESTSAMIATMVSVTREAPENIGSAMKSIISRYGEMTSDPTKLVDSEGEEMSLNRVDAALKSVGITLQNAQGEFKNFDDVILELAQKWNTIDTNAQRYIATIMAGNRQQSRFLALVGNYDQYAKALETANNAEDASALQVLKTMDSIESKITNVKTAWQSFYTSMGLEEMFKGTLDIITQIINNINKMSKFEAITTIFNLFTAVKGLVMGIFAGITNEFSKIKGLAQESLKPFQDTQTIKIDDTETKSKFESIEQQLIQILQKELNLDTNAAKAKLKELGLEVNGNMPKGTNLLEGYTPNNARNLAAQAQGLNTSAFTASQLNNLYAGKDFGKVTKISEEFNRIFGAEAQNMGNALKSYTEQYLIDNNLKGINAEHAPKVIEGFITSLQNGATESEKALGNLLRANAEKYRAEENTAKSTKNFATLIDDHSAGLRVFSTAVQSVGAALTAWALTLKDSSESNVETSKLASGGGSVLSGIGSAVSGALMGAKAGPWGAVIGAIAAGAPAIISGISQIIDGAKQVTIEKLANAENELKELEDDETRAKAKSSGYKTALSELEDLKDAQYDSAEAAQAYKDKMNTLAESYPELVTGMDAAGNAIIDIENLEQLLAEARLATAQATSEALEKELQIAELDKKRAQEALESTSVNDSAFIGETQEVITRTFGDIETIEDLKSIIDFFNSEDVSTASNSHSFIDIPGIGSTDIVSFLLSSSIENGELKYGDTLLDFDSIASQLSGQNIDYKINNVDYSSLNRTSALNREFVEAYIIELEEELADSGLSFKDLSLEDELEAVKKDLEDGQVDNIENLLNLINVELPNALSAKIGANSKIVEEAITSLSRGYANEELAEMAIDDGKYREIQGTYSGIFETIGGKLIENAYQIAAEADKEGDLTLEDWKKTADFEAILNPLSSLNISTYEELGKIWDNMGTYDPKELKGALSELGLSDDIINLIVEAYKESFDYSRELAYNQIENSKVAGTSSILRTLTDNAEAISAPAELMNDINNTVQSANKLYEQGLTARADSLITVAEGFYQAATDLDISEYQEARSIIDDLDLTNIEDLTDARAALEAINTDGQYDALLASIDVAIANCSQNIDALANKIVNETINTLEKINDVINGFSSGFEAKEALEAYKKLEGYKGLLEGKGFDYFFEYDDALGKWVYTSQGMSDILGAQAKEIEVSNAAISDLITKSESEVHDVLGVRTKEGYVKNAKDYYDEETETYSGAWTRLSAEDQAYREWARSVQEQEGLEADVSKEAYIEHLRQQATDGKRAAQLMWEQMIYSLGDTLDFEKIVTGTMGNGRDRERAISTIEEMISANGKNLYDIYGNNLAEQALAALETGHFSDYEKITGDQLSSQEVADLVSKKATALNDAVLKAVEAPGTIIDEATYNILNEAGLASHIKWDEQGFGIVTEAAANYVAMINAIASQGNMILEEQNATLATLYEKSFDANKAKTISDLSSKTSLGFSDLADLATTMGVTMDTFFNEDATDIILSGLDYNKFTGEFDVVDFDAYWQAVTGSLDKNTAEYLEARSQWVDNQIEKSNKKGEEAQSELDALLDAKVGDKINVSYLESLAPNIGQYLGTIVDGVATITDGSNLLGLLQYVTQLDAESNILENSVGELRDSIVELIEGWADAIASGLSGELSFSDAESLMSQFGLKDTDFSETKNGLKLSKEAAYELYLQLKQIAPLQSQLVFDSIAESLSEAGSGYEDVSSTMATIAKLNKELANVPVSSERRAELERELAVAEEILRVRSQDSDSFNFMDKDLPTGMQGPENYWNSVGEAYKVMNESAKSGYMEIQDYVNIVNQMEAMAIAAGQEFSIGGMNAAQLIEKGMSSLKNIDGEGVKIAMEGVGIDFADAATDMGLSFDDGIKEVAKSQIKMLDAAIRILEAMVALEELDIDGSGMLEMDEIFVDGDPGKGFTRGAKDWLKNINLACGDIKIGGKTLEETMLALAKTDPDKFSDFINQMTNIDWTLGDTNVAAQIESLINTFFPGEVISMDKSIFDILEVPLDADKNLKDFKDWAKKAGLTLEKAENLHQWLSKGYDIKQGTPYYDAVKNLLGIEKDSKLEQQFDNTYSFLEEKGMKTTDIIQLWSEIKVDDSSGETKYLYNGNTYDNLDGVLLAKQVEESTGLTPELSNVISNETTGKVTGEMTLGEMTITVSSIGEGDPVYWTSDESFGSPDLNKVIDKEYENYLEKCSQEGITPKSKADLRVEAGLPVSFSFTSSTGGAFNSQAPEFRAAAYNLLQQGVEGIQKAIDAGQNDDGTYTIDLGGQKLEFESMPTPAEVESAVSEALGIDSTTFQSVADAVSLAISNANWDKAGEAIATALIGENGELKIQPTSISIDGGALSSATLADGTSIPEGGIPLTESVKVTAAADPLEITSVTNPTLNLGEEGTIDVGEIGKVEGTASSGLEITIPEGLNADSIDLINQFNSAISAAAANATVNSGITITITGLDDNQITSLEAYNTAASEVPTEEITSKISGEVTIPAVDMLKIIKLKTAVEALKANPSVSSTISAQAEGNALEVVSDILALYGYNNETAQLLFSAIDPENTLNDILTQVNNIQAADDNPLNFLVNLIKEEAEKQLAELTKTETKTIKVRYDEPMPVNPAKPGMYNTQIQVGSNIETRSDATLKGLIDQIKTLVKAGRSPEDEYVIEKVDANGAIIESTTVTVDSNSATVTGVQTVDTPTYSKGETNRGQGTGSSTTPLEIPSLDMSAITTELQTVGEAAATAAADVSGATGTLTGIDTSPIAQATNRMLALTNAVRGIPSSGTTKINNLAGAINNLPSKKSISISYKINVSVSSSGDGTATGRIVGGSGISSFGRNSASGSLAKGNYFGKALASGTRKTLMGELGPELIVSDGRYFLVGQNGAEFVDLADDAIVFNHLQTEKLIKHGHAGTGKPVTNETKAVSLATGNVSGPAMASASAALAQLRQIRAMWQSLLDASAKDLGSKAGSGGGGGGGGGGSGNDEDPGHEYDLERWYNLLRQIAKLEQQITYEQAKRENMQSGYKYVDSLEKEISLLEKQLETEQELADLQYDYYLKRMEEVNKSAYSKIFTYDEDGLMQYVDGKDRGLDALATLQKTDENGALIMNAADQLKYITNTLGISLDDLKYKSDGSKTTTDAEKVEVFFEQVDSIMDEMDELYDSSHEHQEKVEELLTSQNELLQEYLDNQLSVEQKLMQAIQDREQAEIDRIQEEKDALEETAQSYIDGLNDALSKEQDMYSKNETNTETQKLQRQLAILQRSGGSTSEIKSLQDQIDSRLKDAYFQEQQDQIDAIQQASDNQLEKLQTQIDLMTETLEYQKENGLLWQEVYTMMNEWTPEQMLQFIEEYTKSYQENSALQNQEDSEETLKELEIYAGKRDLDKRESAWNKYYSNAQYDDSIKEEYGSAAKEAFNTAFSTGGASAGEAAANKVFSDGVKTKEKEQQQQQQQEPKEEPKEIPSNLYTYQGGGWKFYTYKDPYGGGRGAVFHGNNASPVVQIDAFENNHALITGYDGEGDYFYQRWVPTKFNGKYLWAQANQYKEGGLVDYTGPAWVDGTKSKPEAFLSASDTAMLKSKIFSNSDGSLKSLVAALERITNDTSHYSAETNSEQIVIQNAQVNIQPGVISNDYDARRAGEMALEEMVKIARKTTNRVVSR